MITVDESHYESLRDAIFDDSLERVQELLTIPHLDVDHFDAGGQTMLHLASFWGRMAIVKALLGAGASLKVKNAAGCTALDLATHWGHSSVAEVIRLRGGRSVWEDKMGRLQIQVEDLRMQQSLSQQQLNEKKRQYDELLNDFHQLHTRLEEEKSAGVVLQNKLNEIENQRHVLETENNQLKIDLTTKDNQLVTARTEQAKAQYEKEAAMRELTAALNHRDEILVEMQSSVAKQQELTQQWQIAEKAASIADSLRNFAYAEREKLQKQHTAALGELVVTTERRNIAEHELMVLRNELAEYIYEKERSQILQKRAARAQQRGLDEHQTRPHTVPISSSTTTDSSMKSLDPEVLNCLNIATQKKNRYFSKAARAYGERLRQREARKSQQRVKTQQRVDNQFITQGLSPPVVESELFQQEFVTKLNAFATTRQTKWKELKHDRDRQIGFTKHVQARAIMTAPAPSIQQAAGHENGMSLSDCQPLDSVTTSCHSLSKPSLAPLRRKRTVNLQAYSDPVVDVESKSTASGLESRMRTSFYKSQSNLTQSKLSGVSIDGGYNDG